jgi:hypothetical protein
MEQIHAGTLHGVGVAEGLDVSAAAGSTIVTVALGVAIDALGRHIALAPGAVAELADKPDQGSAPTTVGDNGVALSTAGRSGTCVVTLSWRETFYDGLVDDTGLQRFATDHTPWLRIIPAAEVAADRLVLATLVLDAGGRVTTGD